MDAQLKGKTALVTGGTTGIGFHIAKALAREGAHVAIAARHANPEAVASLQDYGVRSICIEADVSRRHQVVEMVQKAVAEFGHLDFYVNNAAAAHHQALTRVSAAAWEQMVNTNLAACLWGCREAARHMISRQQGAILIVGSTSLYTPGPTETIYRITKVGLKSMSQSLAIELAPHRIRVNLLVPGHYRTRLTAGIPAQIEERLIQEIPSRRFGNLPECGHAAVFLLSDALSGYTTGAELVVDGGLHLRALNFLDDPALRSLNLPEEPAKHG